MAQGLNAVTRIARHARELQYILAFAQRRQQVTGKDFLAAVSTAVDVATTLGEASKSAIRFFRPATCGAIGSALGMAKLAGCDQDQLENTMGTIYSQISGTMQAHTEGSQMLPMQIAVNARAAVVAVDMSLAGMEAPRDVLEGEFGFFTLFEPESELAPGLDQLGKRAQITRVSHKPYPTGRACHGGLDALARILDKRDIQAKDIERAALLAPPLIEHLTGRRPMANMSPSYARLCFPYAAAEFLISGDVNVACFDEENIDEPERLALAERFHVEIEDGHSPNAMTPQTLRLELKNGEILEQCVSNTIGSPDAPLSEKQHLNKFRRCCKDAVSPLPESQIEELIQFVDKLETFSDMNALAELTAPRN